MCKKSIATTLICGLFYSSISWADCAQPVTYLTQGTSSPCDGYLFSPAKEHELRLLKEDHDYLQQESDLKDKMLNNYKLQVDTLQNVANMEAVKSELWRTKAEDSTNKLTAEEEHRGLRDWLFLAAGIALTIGAGYAVGAAHK